MISSATGSSRGPLLASRATALLVVFAAALLCASGAGAANYYACECGSGAEAGCTVGNDAAAGTSAAAAWRTYARLQGAVATSSCGDTFNFCEGGVFAAGPSREWARASQDCSANPRSVRSYDPGAFTRRPRIQGDESVFALNASGARGITIRGLEVKCSGACDGGVGAIYGNVDKVVVDDVIVDGFNVCVQWGTNREMGVRNSTIQNCKSQGLIGPAGSGSYVVDSRILHNGCLETTDQSTCAFQHAHYWNVSSPTITGLRVAGNHYENNVLGGGSGACLGNAFVVRGGTGTVVEDNTFVTPSSGGAPHPLCQVARMSTSQPQQRCVDCAFRGNRILGGAGLLELESWIGGVVENNLLYSPGTDVPAAKTALSVQPSQSGAAPSDGLTIRNNSIAIGSNAGPWVSAGIDARYHPSFGIFGRRLEIVSNAIALLGGGANDVCFRFFDGAVVAGLREDYNVCGRSHPRAAWASTGAAHALAAWREHYPGQGVHSRDADPAFASPGPPRFDFAIGAASPAKDAGDPARSATTDLCDAARPAGAAPDAGAHEHGAEPSQSATPCSRHQSSSTKSDHGRDQ